MDEEDTKNPSSTKPCYYCFKLGHVKKNCMYKILNQFIKYRVKRETNVVDDIEARLKQLNFQ